MRRKIYIIRHGETDYNKKGMVQGSGIDASLNETGRAQGAAFYAKYQEVGFDKIFVSSLRRTKETVQNFLDQGISHEIVSGLEEISWGTQEGVPFTPETATLYQQTTEKWANGEIDAKIDGGESPVEVKQRQQLAMKQIMEQEWSTALVCTHGRAMRILLTWLLGKELSQMDHYEHTNTGLYVLSYDGAFHLEVANDTAHLKT